MEKQYPCEFPRAAGCHEVPQTWGLKQQTCIASQFWRLDVQGRGVVRAARPPEPVGGAFFLPLPASCGFLAMFGVAWLVDALLYPAFSRRLPSVDLGVRISSFSKDIGHTDSGSLS